MPRLSALKKYALFFSVFLVLLLALSWQLLPWILQSQAEKFIADKTRHHLTMSRPEFNPFQLSLRLSGLHLTTPDGQPLLGFRELIVDFSASSLYRGALVFDAIRLDGMDATFNVLPGSKLNWSPFLGSFQSKDNKAESPAPKFDIHKLTLSGTRIDFSDHRISPAFTTVIAPADLDFTDFSSMPGDKGKYRFSASTTLGAKLIWQGQTSLDSMSSTGDFKLDHVNLAALSPLLQDSHILKGGTANLASNYRISYDKGHLAGGLDHLTASLSGLEIIQPGGSALSIKSIHAQGGSFDLASSRISLDEIKAADSALMLKDKSRVIELGQLGVKNIHLDLRSRLAAIKQLELEGGSIDISRDAKGQLNLLKAFSNPAAIHASGPSWKYHLDQLSLSGFATRFRDEASSARFAIQDMALAVDNISDDLSATLPLKASFNSADGGRFEAEGKIAPGLPDAKLHIKLTDLDLKPVQPYLSTLARLKITSGKLSADGTAHYNPKAAGFKGGFSLTDLFINEAGTDTLFLSWKKLASRSIEVTQSALNVDEILLNGLDTALIINKDKTVSFKRILLPPSVSPKTAGAPFEVNIDRLRFTRGEMDFADYSLALPFGTRIHDLKGVITGLSTRPDALGHVELDGQVDEYGVARAVGQIDLADPTDLMDIKVVFRNIEMSKLTPYSATFAGRKIASGKLSLDLEYKIKQRQLQGKNQVVMDQLVLGDKVSSPDAKDLPLDLAISILQDSDGRIDLGLPVSGSLDDPKFSYGSIIWQAISNILTKIATAPFRALGALFGGDDKFENIVFEAGSSQLSPPEREKLVQLANVLTKRPALTISIQGVHSNADRLALQDLQMRRSVASQSNQHTEDDPGPLSVRQPKVQNAIETLFSDQFGGGELAAIKDGYRQANPGKLTETVSGKLLSGLTGLFRQQRKLSDKEISSLKGTDLHTVLFERLRSAVQIDDKQLLALADARGVATFEGLKSAGVSLERLTIKSSEKLTTDGRDIPVKLILGTSR